MNRGVITARASGLELEGMGLEEPRGQDGEEINTCTREARLKEARKESAQRRLVSCGRRGNVAKGGTSNQKKEGEKKGARKKLRRSGIFSP